MKPNLTKLENLTDEQLHTISTDVEKIGFRQASAKAASELGRDIDKSTVQRFVARGSVKEFLDETPDTAAAATEVLRYAATGIPSFTEATVQVLDQTAFKLSLVCTRTEEEMKALTQVNTILYRHRSQSVRERMAAVQERKAKLREQELELRHSQKSSSAFSPQPSALPDHLGDLALTGDDIERRTCAKFNLKYEPPDESSPRGPHVEERPALSGQPISGELGKLTTGTPPESSLGRDDFHGVPNIEKPVAAPRASAALREGTNSSVPEANESNSEISNLHSQIELYRQTEKNSETLTSPPLPSCPSVENAPKREAPHLKCQMKNASRMRDSMLNESLISHAIRRWRAYQPRRYQDPEPTISWTSECPCGAKIPCEKHGDLSINVRYLNPADPKYAAALKEAGIPHYIPSRDELTRSEPTDMPCTSVFYTGKKVSKPTPHLDET